MNRIENHLVIDQMYPKPDPECSTCHEPLGEEYRCFFCESKDMEVDIEIEDNVMPEFYLERAIKTCKKRTPKAVYYAKSEPELISQATEYAKEYLGAWGYPDAYVEITLR